MHEYYFRKILIERAMHRNHDLVEAIINQKFYVPLGENFVVRDHTHIGYAALLGEPHHAKETYERFMVGASFETIHKVLMLDVKSRCGVSSRELWCFARASLARGLRLAQ
jgi:hypothetical protein